MARGNDARGSSLVLAIVLGALIWRVIWKPPAPLTDAQLQRFTASGAKSEGARSATVPGLGRMTYFEYGDPSGAPVLALHGLGASGLMYSTHDAFFRARGLRCIAPNFAGALADLSPDARIKDLAERTTALMNTLGFSRYRVIAISYGTLVGLGVAALHPDRVVHLGLFGALAPGQWLAAHPGLTKGARPNDATLWSLAGRSPWLLYPLTALFGAWPTSAQVRSFDDPVMPEAERSMLARGSPFAALFGRLLEECGQRGAWYLASATRIGWGRDPGFTLDDVDRGGAKIFVSTGELDNVHLPAIARFLAERVRAARLELVPNQGRFGVMGPGLEAGLSRFLEAERAG